MKKKILLVEDNYYLLELYKNAIEGAGYELITAINGEEAETLANSSLDLILLDIMLPQKTGADLLRIWRNNDTLDSIPIILLTNLGKEEVIEELFDLGADGYILKSTITPKTLVEEIKTLFTKTD